MRSSAHGQLGARRSLPNGNEQLRDGQVVSSDCHTNGYTVTVRSRITKHLANGRIGPSIQDQLGLQLSHRLSHRVGPTAAPTATNALITGHIRKDP